MKKTMMKVRTPVAATITDSHRENRGGGLGRSGHVDGPSGRVRHSVADPGLVLLTDLV